MRKFVAEQNEWGKLSTALTTPTAPTIASDDVDDDDVSDFEAADDVGDHAADAAADDVG